MRILRCDQTAQRVVAQLRLSAQRVGDRSQVVVAPSEIGRVAKWVGHAQALPGTVASGGTGLAQRRGHRGQAAGGSIRLRCYPASLKESLHSSIYRLSLTWRDEVNNG